MIKDNFRDFCEELTLDSLSEIQTTIGEIAKKLNSNYYELDSDAKSNIYIVGSLGRGTAITNCSDVDLIFNLPKEVYNKFDNYESNGQSSLLQEVKEVLETRYPKTKKRGDGQVVVIEFQKYTIELVPAFKQDDNSFIYPDTHNGGSWKKTDPISEQLECIDANNSSNGIYYDFCRLIRAWKNQIGFKFGGLLIDTLVYNHFKSNDYYKNSSLDNYLDILSNLFKYLKSQNKDQAYWLAVGSNQQVYNSSNGNFVAKADSAYSKLNEATEDTLLAVLVELFGKDFDNQKTFEENAEYNKSSNNTTEEFIEDKFIIDIQYDLTIDCVVSQNGFRDFLLRHALLDNHILRHNKQLKFFIDKNDVPYPYGIYWKVRNVGSIAEQKRQVRGEIRHTDLDYQKERSSFRGPHYVECYIVKNNICVARARIDVPIGDC